MMKQKVDHMNPPGADMVARVGRMRSEMTIAQVVGHVVIWLIATMITFGIGAFFLALCLCQANHRIHCHHRRIR